jgi:hypothetical protein
VIAYKRDCASIRSPETKTSTDEIAGGRELLMRAEELPKSFMTAFSDEMKIKFTQRPPPYRLEGGHARVQM